MAYTTLNEAAAVAYGLIVATVEELDKTDGFGPPDSVIDVVSELSLDDAHMVIACLATMAAAFVHLMPGDLAAGLAAGGLYIATMPEIPVPD